MPSTLANREIVVLAVFFLGGDSVEMEDVAVEAHKLEAERFSWKYHAAQINLKSIDAALRDSRRSKFGTFTTSSGSKWSLTAAGRAWATKNQSKVSRLTGQLNPEIVLRITLERTRLLESTAHKKVVAGLTEEVSLADSEALFSINCYVPDNVKRQKIQELCAIFEKDEYLTKTVTIARKKLLCPNQS